MPSLGVKVYEYGKDGKGKEEKKALIFKVTGRERFSPWVRTWLVPGVFEFPENRVFFWVPEETVKREHNLALE